MDGGERKTVPHPTSIATGRRERPARGHIERRAGRQRTVGEQQRNTGGCARNGRLCDPYASTWMAPARSPLAIGSAANTAARSPPRGDGGTDGISLDAVLA